MARKRIYGDAVTDAASAGIDFNGLGSAEVIEIAAIQVDPEYQRGLRHELVNRIAADWDIVKAGPILVNERTEQWGGGLWCVDGQHRMGGATQAGETEIFAHVTHGLTPQQEAALRLARNDRRSDTVFEKFRARLHMGDEKAHSMVEVVRQAGTRLNLVADVHHGINALSAAETLYDAGSGGGVWLGRSLRTLVEAFGVEDEVLGGRAVGQASMKSVAWFLDRHVAPGDVRETELVEKLSIAGIDEIDRKARNHKAISGGAMWLNYYRAMVEVWNHGRQEKNKLEAKTSGSISELGDDSTRRHTPWSGD